MSGDGEKSYFYQCGNCGQYEQEIPIYDRTKTCGNCGAPYRHIQITGGERMK
jgi:hypothetical protein